MERRHFLQSIALASSSSLIISSCSNAKKPVENLNYSNGHIIHVVYFWLKEDLTDDDEKDFLKFFEILKTVPTVKSLQVCKPAPTNPRDVVDNSFSYNILVGFDSMKDINVYETHAIHTDAAAKYSKYWTKVQVRDSVVV